MCYDVETGTRIALKYAKHRGDAPEVIDALEEEIKRLQTFKPLYAQSGFAHPNLLVFANDKPFTPQTFQWGLIPHWVRDQKTAATMMKQTLNARAETMFDKPSFRDSAKNRRCLIYLDAFYEHHHAGSTTYPFRISMKDGSTLAIAGLWDEWTDKTTGEIRQTVSIITTEANEVMANIHNKPKLAGPRMPAILQRNLQDAWLAPCRSADDQRQLLQFVKPIPSEALTYHTVQRLKGKQAHGNVPEAEEEFIYSEFKGF
jgi:putative SOS response-associated peptidase YedK